MAAQLILRKDDFFASASQAVAVADRYPQNVFAEHTHEFCELVLVWRGNGKVDWGSALLPPVVAAVRPPVSWSVERLAWAVSAAAGSVLSSP